MRLSSYLIVLLLLQAFVTTTGSAQQRSKSNYSRTRYNNAANVKGKKAKIVCPIFTQNKFPYHGIGFKIGDPFALTYKLFAGKKISIALDLGKAASGLYSRDYRDRFDDYLNRDTVAEGSTLAYLTTNVKADWASEIKALYNIDAAILSPGLQFYVGVGVQVKQTQLEYAYLYDAVRIGKFTRTFSSVGQTTIAGLEYNYSSIPVSFFMELEFYTTIQNPAVLTRFQGGAGLRYVFR
jgi:hypothetical protein